ncbi:hypothetical protein ITJ86_01115 [Winogradskyella sp. F6397]|uniref:50S ribosomal protein L35 n=1 Tax=Winogradskyella marina TaxID=2785530 RepID=A0ABS0EDG9_9FLAO|nr:MULTISPECIES: hypothetical protein [Winogradskyella]MBF8148475.1 hypothetical protein [Winogradskyella marina]
MKSKITEKIAAKAKRVNKKVHFTTRGLLNSAYKRTVKRNFKKRSKKTLFGIRQRVRSPKLSKASLTVSMVLKLLVFASIAVVACI